MRLRVKSLVAAALCGMFTRKPELTQSFNITGDTTSNAFWRSAKWSCDGSAVLATREDKSVQVWNNPRELGVSSSIFSQAAPVLEAVWYPGARTCDPPSYCFVASVRDAPIKLLDGADGRLRASYKIVDHVERFVAPHSMVFNCMADKLYCGHQDAIEIFDVQHPGEGKRVMTRPSRKSKTGLKGIVSSIAFSPDFSGLYAAGSLTSALWLFTENQGSEPVCRVRGTSSAITQVKFNPAYPEILYAACRQHNLIYAWDIRNPSTPYTTYERKGLTNQKLFIDVDATGTWLVSGDPDGGVSFFNLSAKEEAAEPEYYYFNAHSDSVGAAVFHPSESTLLTVSGSRHFNESEGEDSDSEDGMPSYTSRSKPTVVEATMKIWSL